MDEVLDRGGRGKKGSSKIAYFISSWNQFFWRWNTKLRSRSFRVVVSSISSAGLSVERPWEDPLRSNRLWIRYSEQNKLPITMNRVWYLTTIVNWASEIISSMNKALNMSNSVYFLFISNTYLLTTNRFDTMHAIEFCHKGIFVPANMLVITWKHPYKDLT